MLFDPAETLDQEAFNAEVVKVANARRAGEKRPPVDVAFEVQAWLNQRSGDGGLEPLQTVLDDLTEAMPRYTAFEAVQITGKRVQNLLQEAQNWTPDSARDHTHLTTFLTRDSGGGGEVTCTVVALRQLPFFEPRLLSETHAEFCAKCSLCGHEHPAAIERDIRGLVLRCPSCQKAYDMLCQDIAGDYRHVNHFLTGFEPPAFFPEEQTKLDEMLTVWRAVLGHCRYESDVNGASGQRDQWQSSAQTHEFRNGDCEDTSILLADWLISRGFQARVALGVMNDGHGAGGGHAWVIVRVGDKDYLLESTAADVDLKNPPTVASFGHNYFPQMLFDRENLYFRKNDGWTPDYWSKREWSVVHYGPSAEEAGEEITLSVGPEAKESDPWVGAKK